MCDEQGQPEGECAEVQRILRHFGEKKEKCPVIVRVRIEKAIVELQSQRNQDEDVDS